MTPRPGSAGGDERARRPGLLAAPAAALVAVLLGPAGSSPVAHRAGVGAQSAAAASVPTAADPAVRPAASGAMPPPPAPAAPGPADPVGADPAAGPPAAAPPGASAREATAAGAADPGRQPGPSAAAAVEPADPSRPAQTWAVIVGINRYPRGDHDLRTAAADARDVDDALAGYGVPADHRLLILDRDATAANIRASLGWLTARAAPQDTAVVFFAGHAAHVGGGRRQPRPEVAVIGADDTPVPQSQLAGLLAPLRARSAWLAMAACYGAEFDGLLGPGRLLTAAAGRGQLAYENDALPHSYLVEYMVQRAMIEGDAARSVEDSFQWARAQIAQHYPGREPTMVDDRSAPLVLGAPSRHPGRSAAGAPGRSNEPGAPAPGRDPAPPPAASDPGTPPDEGGCTHVGDAVRLCGRS